MRRREDALASSGESLTLRGKCFQYAIYCRKDEASRRLLKSERGAAQANNGREGIAGVPIHPKMTPEMSHSLMWGAEASGIREASRVPSKKYIFISFSLSSLLVAHPGWSQCCCTSSLCLLLLLLLTTTLPSAALLAGFPKINKYFLSYRLDYNSEPPTKACFCVHAAAAILKPNMPPAAAAVVASRPSSGSRG